MSKQVLLDNDVVLKIACYSLVSEILAAITIEGTTPGMLGVGRFVIKSRLGRARGIADVESAKAAFERMLEEVSLLEPDYSELEIAAELEAEANRRNLELDGGECQLLAILTNRACRVLVTGDKRAIAAMTVVAPEMAADRIGCLEQVMAHLVQLGGVDAVRTRVCTEPGVDRAISVCFSCSHGPTRQEEVLAGLASYIGYLNKKAPGLLLPGCDLSALA